MTRRGLLGLLASARAAKAIPPTPLRAKVALADVGYQVWHATVIGGHITYRVSYFHPDAFVMTWPRLERGDT